MNQPYQAALDKASRSTVLLGLARTTQDTIDLQAEELSDQQIEQVGLYACRATISSSVNATLILGGFCLMMKAVGERGDRPDLYASFLEEVGSDSKRGSEAIQVFDCFGRELFEEPELISRFPERSLFKLSRDYVPQAARDEALQRARRGERIAMKIADEILAAYLPDAATGQDPVRGADTEDTDEHEAGRDNSAMPRAVGRRTTAKGAKRARKRVLNLTTDSNVTVDIWVDRDSPISFEAISAALTETVQRFRHFCAMEEIESDRTMQLEVAAHV